jgi:hypothetical protein
MPNPVTDATAGAPVTSAAPGPATIDWSDMSCHITPHFTVGEYLQHDPNRIPGRLPVFPGVGSKDAVMKNAAAICAQCELIRAAWMATGGGALTFTSGYRPPKINTAQGGAASSRHLWGDAVDIRPVNATVGSPLLKQFQDWLDQHWFGGLGYGAHRGFVHVDLRNGKGFDAGGPKGTRWSYP